MKSRKSRREVLSDAIRWHQFYFWKQVLEGRAVKNEMGMIREEIWAMIAMVAMLAVAVWV